MNKHRFYIDHAKDKEAASSNFTMILRYDRSFWEVQLYEIQTTATLHLDLFVLSERNINEHCEQIHIF